MVLGQSFKRFGKNLQVSKVEQTSSSSLLQTEHIRLDLSIPENLPVSVGIPFVADTSEATNIVQ
jgi:hypothetical protein